jgi:hypothetical protein
VDCEKFDRVVLDLLYEELDELTSAAARRHLEQCSRCHAIDAGLRATREVGVLPMVEPPGGLAERILDAERDARATMPLRHRFGRAVSVVAGYAMRPQLAMAAVFLLMIGTSLLLIRARPGDRASAQVTERGVPESESEPAAPATKPAADETRAPRGRPPRAEATVAEPSPPPVAAATPAEPAAMNAGLPGGAEAKTPAQAEAPAEDDEQLRAANQAFADGKYDDAARQFDEIARGRAEVAPQASLMAARAARDGSGGCATAARRFENVRSRFRDTPQGREATWYAADCYQALGDLERARSSYRALLGVEGYSQKASQALAQLEARSGERVAARKAAASAPAKAKAAAPPAAGAKPQQRVQQKKATAVDQAF